MDKNIFKYFKLNLKLSQKTYSYDDTQYCPCLPKAEMMVDSQPKLSINCIHFWKMLCVHLNALHSFYMQGAHEYFIVYEFLFM